MRRRILWPCLWKCGNQTGVRNSRQKALWFAVMLAVTQAAPGAGEADGSRAGVTNRLEWREGGIIRGPRDRRQLALVFTGHTFAEGADTILSELDRHGAKASFFLTGDFLTNANFRPLIKRLVSAGHYLGPHSDQHLLYCSWGRPSKTLVTRGQFLQDLQRNLAKIEREDVDRAKVRYFLPAFEHYNQEVADWSGEAGLRLINFTPGTRSTADYTGEADTNFVSSRAILDSILAADQRDPNGLNGYLLLLHLGSGPGRSDKFHPHVAELLDYLVSRGYRLVRVDELLEGK